ncbi:hypothetical protein RJ640_023966, partial [Escallonia rubra]
YYSRNELQHIYTTNDVSCIQSTLGNTVVLVWKFTLLNFKCFKLTRLDLSANSFSGIVPNSLGNLRLLKVLRMGDNNFINGPSSPELSFITSLTKCKKLRVLSIRRNPIAGTLPVSIGNLSASLQYFYAYRCRIRGTIPNEIGNLSFFGNELSGFIPNTIKGL